ncbi:MAG: ibpA [Bacteroidetes bacterium]|nr:ibpA [Bacteroidota bacterium]
MNRIEQLYNEWTSLQPLKPEDKKRLDEKFRLEFNYNSNHIEGNTLTYGQTKLLLIFGDTTGNAKLQDYEEMRAHDVGFNIITQEAKDIERPLSEAFIRELNKTILVRPFWKDAVTDAGQPTRMEVKIGEYKSRPNHVQTATGEIFYYATPEETPIMMKELVEWYNDEADKKQLSPIELAALLHYRYIRIHPFEDGNGRIARLLVNYVLIRNNYPPIIIQSKDKDNYLRILHQCDVAVGLTASEGASATIDGIRPFVEYMNEQLEHSLILSVKAAKGESIEEEDDFAKQLTLLQRKLKYSNTKPEFSEEQVWNVLENFYFPFTEKLERSISATKSFFDTSRSGNYLLKNDNTQIHLNKSLRGNASNQILDYIRNAKAMIFHYQLTSSKDFRMGHLSINVDLKVIFQKDGYIVSCLNDRKFEYEQYPTQEELDTSIAQYKADILNKIKNAVRIITK